MSAASERALRVPNANNPRVLIRMIGLVAAGVRRPTALAEILDVELRTVHYYTQAGEWLGLISTDGDVHLTPHGIDLAFADPNQRLRRYAAAVWRTPFARDLLRGRRTMPDIDAIAAFILESSGGELSESTARRRASAVRSLLEPAIGRKPGRRQAQGEQVGLPFPPRSAPDALAGDLGTVDLRAGLDHNPDVYARVLTTLLDHGELSTGQLRALLDHVGGGDCPLGPYAEMAVRRGDAVRVDDRLVVTRGAIRRREVAAHGTLIALSDPAYRAWLDVAVTPLPDDLKGRRERERLAARHAAWDRHVFGAPLTPERASGALQGALPGRDPRSLPLAGDAGAALARGTRPFLSSLDQPGLPIALPAALSEVAGGVKPTNAVLRRVRAAPAGVRLPGVADRRLVMHGGLLAPGEPLPRAVPDNLTLRMRLLTNAPAVSMYAALLLLARRAGSGLSVEDAGSGPEVRHRRRAVGPLLRVFEAFADAQGWVCSRPTRGGLSGPVLEAVARTLGIGTRAGRRVVMEERLFVQLQEDAEARITYDQLRPLVDRMDAWLGGLDREEEP
jgi:hypothetical protein